MCRGLFFFFFFFFFFFVTLPQDVYSNSHDSAQRP
jgi:hypothetical protein